MAFQADFDPTAQERRWTAFRDFRARTREALRTSSEIATLATFAASLYFLFRTPSIQALVSQPVELPLGVALLAAVGLLLMPRSVRGMWQRLSGRHRIVALGEIQGQLGPRLLGAIPSVNLDGQLTAANPAAPYVFVEAFRRVRTNMIFSANADRSPKIVLVTSAGPDEGKTTVALNLSIVTAWAGQRVLIIDCDIRRSRVHRAFNLARSPGLTELMVGGSKASEIVSKSGVPGLWVIPAGRLAPNPSELLGSQRFADFLTSLRDHFDYVFLDAPPVLSVSEPLILGHRSDGIVLVGRVRKTSLEAARQTMAQLADSKGAVIGWVFTDVKSPRDTLMYADLYEPLEEDGEADLQEVTV